MDGNMNFHSLPARLQLEYSTSLTGRKEIAEQQERLTKLTLDDPNLYPAAPPQ